MKTKQILIFLSLCLLLFLLFSACGNSQPAAELLEDDTQTKEEQAVPPVNAKIVFQLNYISVRSLTHFETGAYYGARGTIDNPFGHILYIDFETKKVSVTQNTELEKVLDTYFFTDENYLYYVRFDGHNIVLYRASLEGENAVALSYPEIPFQSKFIVSDENGCLYMEFYNGNDYNELVKFDFNNMNQEVVYSNYGPPFHITGVRDGKILLSQKTENSLHCHEYDIANNSTTTIGVLSSDETFGHKRYRLLDNDVYTWLQPNQHFIDNYTNTQYMLSDRPHGFFEGVILTASNIDTGETYEIKLKNTDIPFYSVVPLSATEDFFIVIADYYKTNSFADVPIFGYIPKQDYDNGFYNVTPFDYGDILNTIFAE